MLYYVYIQTSFNDVTGNVSRCMSYSNHFIVDDLLVDAVLVATFETYSDALNYMTEWFNKE